MAFLLRMAIRRWPVLLLLGIGGMLAPVRAAAHEPVDIVILLDNSTSMRILDNGQPGTDMQFMRLTAVQYLLEKLAPQDRLAVLTFDTTVQAGKNRDPFASHLHSAQELSQPG